MALVAAKALVAARRLPNTVSVKSVSEAVGLAIRSSSGTCLYARVAAASVTYGSGPACTGDAALDASKPAWPTPA